MEILCVYLYLVTIVGQNLHLKILIFEYRCDRSNVSVPLDFPYFLPLTPLPFVKTCAQLHTLLTRTNDLLLTFCLHALRFKRNKMISAIPIFPIFSRTFYFKGERLGFHSYHDETTLWLESNVFLNILEIAESNCNGSSTFISENELFQLIKISKSLNKIPFKAWVRTVLLPQLYLDKLPFQKFKYT